jgi:predicted RNA binding protein YcfA (HicA-like mRNA interferase family)
VSPALSDFPVRAVTRALEAVGFERVRVKGSRAVYRRTQDGKVTVVPEPGTVNHGTLASIVRQAGLTAMSSQICSQRGRTFNGRR